MLQENRYIINIFYYYDDFENPKCACFPYKFNLKSIDNYFTKHYDVLSVLNEKPKVFEDCFGKDYDKNKVEIFVCEQDAFGNFTIELDPILYNEDIDVLDVGKTDKEFRKHLDNPRLIIDFILSVVQYCDKETSRELLKIVVLILEGSKKDYTSKFESIISNLSGYIFDRTKYICVRDHKIEMARLINKEKNDEEKPDIVDQYSGGNIYRFSENRSSTWVPTRKK